MDYELTYLSNFFPLPGWGPAKRKPLTKTEKKVKKVKGKISKQSKKRNRK